LGVVIEDFVVNFIGKNQEGCVSSARLIIDLLCLFHHRTVGLSGLIDDGFGFCGLFERMSLMSGLQPASRRQSNVYIDA